MPVCCSTVLLCKNNEQLAAVSGQASFFVPCRPAVKCSLGQSFANMMSIIECAASAVAMSWYSAAKVTLCHKDRTKLYPYRVIFYVKLHFL